MMIESLRDHWPARKMEWMMTVLTFSWGAYILIHPEIFYNPATALPLSGLTRIAEGFNADPARFWGLAALAMGLLRGTGLFINGAYVRTPVWRTVAAFASMFIFTQVSIAIIRSGVPNLGIVIYPWLVAVDLLSAYRAGQDAVYAEMQRRSQKGTLSAALPYLRAE